MGTAVPDATHHARHSRHVLARAGAIAAAFAAMSAAPATASDQSTPDAAPFVDRVVTGHAGAPSQPRAAATPGTFTFVIDPTWSQSEGATLSAWLAPGSPERRALTMVAGPPSESATITITHDPSSSFAGEYTLATHTVTLANLDLGVLMHELDHATHGPWILTNGDVWEEGMARAAEVAEMNMLARDGVAGTAGYFDLHHSYPYDTAYDALNRPNVGLEGGNIFSGTPSLVLLRYELAGYAFGKILVQNPAFLRSFNARLYTHPDGGLSVATFLRITSSIQPKVEGAGFAAWYAGQHVFDRSPPLGCRLYQRAVFFVVDVFCRTTSGETPQPGAAVTVRLTSAQGATLGMEQATTNQLGAGTYPSPAFGSYRGRVTFTATAVVAGQTLRQTEYMPESDTGTYDTGVSGVVTNAVSGKVTFSSPGGRFATFTVRVTNGAFHAARLDGFAGQVVATYKGPTKTATRQFTKDASPYTVELTAK
jgi:hypothetical protein